MRFKLDENLPREAAEVLRGAGFDAHSVLDQGLGGASDPQLAEVCRLEGRVLVTLDLDFANIRAYPPAESPGILVFRLAVQDRDSVLNALRGSLGVLSEHSPAGKLWILEGDRIRIRD